VKVGAFELTPEIAEDFLRSPNPHGRPNSDVLLRWVNARDLTARERRYWIINFQTLSQDDAARYEKPFTYVEKYIKPDRVKNRDRQRRTNWWRLGRSGEDWTTASANLHRTIFTPRVGKYRPFVWVIGTVLPDSAVVAFARDDDYCFGILHSRLHEVWARVQGTQLRERESGFRYTPTTCFETFPFPEPKEQQKIDISTAAKELNELRENWLNPPEWTTTRMLEFPGATDGPWSRFVVDPDARDIGTVRYPRVEARDDGCAKKLAKRSLTNLYNERPAWLANAHAKLDAAVAAAYSFPVDLTDEQILERLLVLNQQRIGDEKPATKKQPRVSRAKTDEELV
jgi:type II restriction/modification system DNA methylase subunit YeeA